MRESELQRLFEILVEWYQDDPLDGPTLPQLCERLGRPITQKATVQRMLQELQARNLVTWERGQHRSYRPVAGAQFSSAPPATPKATTTGQSPAPRIQELESNPQYSIYDTIRYVSAGLIEWERLSAEDRVHHRPLSLRIGFSRYMTLAKVCGFLVPASHAQWLELCHLPLDQWPGAEQVRNLPHRSLLVNNSPTDLCRQWAVNGKDRREVEAAAVADFRKACSSAIDQAAYVRGRQDLLIRKCTLRAKELSAMLPNDVRLSGPLKKAFQGLDTLPRPEYHLCPRCRYPMRPLLGGYRCVDDFCEEQRVAAHPEPEETISASEAEAWVVVRDGVYHSTVLPGLPEVALFDWLETLKNEGANLTFERWPDFDTWDVRVKVRGKTVLTADIKDWSYLTERRLRENPIYMDPAADKTFMVFPDEREPLLRVRTVRPQLRSTLPDIQLTLVSEFKQAVLTALEGGTGGA